MLQRPDVLNGVSWNPPLCLVHKLFCIAGNCKGTLSGSRLARTVGNSSSRASASPPEQHHEPAREPQHLPGPEQAQKEVTGAASQC